MLIKKNGRKTLPKSRRTFVTISKSILSEHITKYSAGNIYWKDINSVFLGCNFNMAKVFGFKSSTQIRGKTDYDFFKDEKLVKQILLNDKKVISSGDELTFEEVGISSNLEKIYYISKKAPLRNSNGEIVGIIGTSIDITEQKKTEKALYNANKVKEEFIQNMEHDIRTPLIGIVGIASMLLDKEKNIKKQELLTLWSKSGKTLLEIFDSILSFKDNINNDNLINMDKIDIRLFFKKLIELESAAARLNSVEIYLKADSRVPKYILSDHLRLHKILLNLLSNAIKFTKEGKVILYIIYAKQVDVNNCILKFIVEDTGIGIPKQHQKNIFHTFSKVHVSNQGRFLGTGIGLKTVKNIVKDLKGKVSVESNFGEGSKFIVTIPTIIPSSITIEKGDTSQITSTADLKNLRLKKHNIIYDKINRILLIEDDEIAQIVEKTILKNFFRCSIDVVSTGKEALMNIKKNKYDLILIDIGLPDGNGYDFARKIIASNKDVCIFPLTAHTTTSSILDICAKVGMKKSITKPLTIEKIQNFLMLM